MRFVVPSPLLRNVLIVDAAFSGASGLTLAAVVAQATVVAAIAAGQWIGLKRSEPAPA